MQLWDIELRQQRRFDGRGAGSLQDLLVGEGRADLVVGGLVVVELKALPALAPVHLAQIISYLKAMGLGLGLLVNFGERHLKTGCRRVVLTR